jgi:hypothetical protein
VLCWCCCLGRFLSSSSIFDSASVCPSGVCVRARVLTMSEPTKDDVAVDQAAADLEDVEVVASETAAGLVGGGGQGGFWGPNRHIFSLVICNAETDGVDTSTMTPAELKKHKEKQKKKDAKKRAAARKKADAAASESTATEDGNAENSGVNEDGGVRSMTENVQYFFP